MSTESLLRGAGVQVFERGWLSSNNVLFAANGSKETVLVDSGYATHAEQTLALVRNALGTRPLDRVVNTHLHSDHCGGNHLLQATFGCAIDVPIGEAAKVDRWDEDALSYAATGQTCPRFRRTGSIRDGDEISLGALSWRVIAAPGHDPESVVLYQPDQEVLISADALWENGFGIVFPELEGEQAFELVRQTLDCIGQLPIKVVVPGHGSPFQGSTLALERAYSRLESFVSDPRRHSRYAAKVLAKFHLLEVQRQRRADLICWMAETKLMRLSHSRYFAANSMEDWCHDILRDLHASKAIGFEGDFVFNA